jgi:hypothetical protein
MADIVQIVINGVTYDLKDAAARHEKPDWNASANTPAEILNKPDLSQFITNTVDNLVNYYLKTETYTKAEVEALIGAINQFHYEIYASTSAVTSPASNVLYLIGPTGSGADKYEEYVYTNSAFVKIGDTSIDLSGYVTTQALNTALADKVDKVAGATNGNFAGLDSNGNLIDSGSKAADFATAEQGRKADGAVRFDTVQSRSDEQKAQARTNMGAGTYSKPSGGIPASDMTSEVQASLGKADTAVQPAALEAVTDLIPEAASSSNQLADKAFVNSSISTATATFRGTYNLVSDLLLTVSATQSQIATALGTAISTADNNDYAFVQIPTADATPTEIARVERYKYNGSAWAFEYALNNSGFTAAQWAALNSGITSGLVSKLSALPTNTELTNLLAGKQPTIDSSHKLDYSLVDNTPTIPDAVEANPTVPSGTTPTDLAGLKVGSSYYGIPQLPTVDNAPTANSNNLVKSGGVYSEIHPAVQSSQPQGGFLPNVEYNLGTLTGTVTFALASAVSGIVNHYYWTFDTGGTAPTITWPAGISWNGGAAPTINASKHYEISVLDGVGAYMEV